MTMHNVFNDLGAQAAIDFGRYQAKKGEKADFVDFLLSYDAKAAEEGDSNWLTSLSGVNEDELLSITDRSAQMLGIDNPLSNISFLQNSNYFDVQVNALKLQLSEGFKQRIENSNNSALVKSEQIKELYDTMQSIQIPNRFRG